MTQGIDAKAFPTRALFHALAGKERDIGLFSCELQSLILWVSPVFCNLDEDSFII